MSWLVIAVGAVLGAWLRWSMGLWLNMLNRDIPLGTLAVNWGGGYLAGLALAFFTSHPGVSPEWRLLAVTGFLGTLTTFSTFSVESVTLIQRGDYMLALVHSALHLIGSILFCIAGFATYKAFA